MGARTMASQTFFNQIKESKAALSALLAAAFLGALVATLFSTQKALPGRLEAQSLVIRANTVRIEGAEARLDSLEVETGRQTDKLNHITDIVCIPLTPLQKRLARCPR